MTVCISLCPCLLLGPPSHSLETENCTPASGMARPLQFARPSFRGQALCVLVLVCVTMPILRRGSRWRAYSHLPQQLFICPVSFLVLHGEERTFVRYSVPIWSQTSSGKVQTKGRGSATCCEMEPSTIRAVRVRVWAGMGAAGTSA